MSKEVGSGRYTWKEDGTWFGVDFNDFVKHSVKHDKIATAEALRNAGVKIKIMYTTPTGVIKPKEK